MSDLNRPPILIPFYHLKRFQSSSFFLYSLILQTLSLSTSNHLLLKRSFEKWLNLPMSFMFAMLVMRFLKMICISFFNHLGLITKLVMLRAKNQTLLQMQDVPSAASALQFFTNVEPTIRGRNVYVQFSSHQELTTIEQNIHRREDEPNCILLVTIYHMLYPITVDVLHQVFSPYGFVEKRERE